jgi:hypothetical protein
MKWRLDADHVIDESVLPAGTIIGDDTNHPFRALKDDMKIGRKKGDALPPSVQMSPMDDEARKAFSKKFGEEAPNRDPLAAIPLTGAPDAPKVKGPAAPQPVVNRPGPAPIVAPQAAPVTSKV